MSRWSWNITNSFDMNELVSYYKNNYNVTDDGGNTVSLATVSEVNDGENWSREASYFLSTLWTRKEGRHSSDGDIKINLDEYDENYFFDNHTAAEMKTIADDLDANRTNIQNYDAADDYHVALINNIVYGLNSLRAAK